MNTLILILVIANTMLWIIVGTVVVVRKMLRTMNTKKQLKAKIMEAWDVRYNGL